MCDSGSGSANQTLPRDVSYLLIGLWNQTGNAAVSVQKVLEVLVADDKPLGLPQTVLPCVLAVNQQALKHLEEQHTNTQTLNTLTYKQG